jgi:hypothetical protein
MSINDRTYVNNGRSVGQSILVTDTHLWPMTIFLLLSAASLFAWCALRREDGSRTQDSNLLPHIRDPPPGWNAGSRIIPYSYSIGRGWPTFTPRRWVPFSTPFNDSQVIRAALPYFSDSSSSYVTTDGQSAGLS